MADVFISYDRDDVERARGLAEAFEGLGWSVWWDDRIRTGSPFDQVIDEQLDAAACVIVVWSSASVSSSWVRAEAHAGDEQGKLLPVSFERDLRLPVRFRQLRVTHLTSTDISEGTGEAGGLLADIARLTGHAPTSSDPRVLEGVRQPRSSGANLITAGRWRITVRFAGIRGRYDLNLRPNGTVTGTAKWAISRADVAGQWRYDPSSQVLQLEMSGGIQEGTKEVPVAITRWVNADTADCTFEHRPGRIERLERR